MSTLAIPNTFSSGATITASGHNQNYTAISNWAAGGIGEDNLDTMAGPIVWSVSSNVLGINMTNSGTEGSVLITNNTNLAAGKAVFKVIQNNTGPALQVDSTTAPVRLPRMTTAQRDAISATEGDEIYNTSLKRKEIYNGSYWVAAAGNSGMIVDWPAATLPPHLVELDGSTVANNGTNAYIINILGGTTLPDLRGRATIGAGTYTDTVSGSVTRTLGASLGAEKHVITTSEMASHDHGGGVHNHSLTDSGHVHSVTMGGGLGGGIYPAQGTSTPSGSATSGSNASAGYSVNNSGSIISSVGSNTAHNNMQPSYVVKKCIVL